MHVVPTKMHGSCFDIRQWYYPVCKRSQISWFDLGFKTHLWISYQIPQARCQKSLNIMNVLSHTEWGADRTTLLKLYCSLVRSKLDYGCIVYGSASKTALVRLDPVHNQGLRLSLGAFCSSPVETLYVEAHELPLQIRRERLTLRHTIKLKAHLGNPAYGAVFNPKQIDVVEIAIKSIPDVPIWDSKPVTVDFTLSECDKSSTSSVFKSRFNASG